MKKTFTLSLLLFTMLMSTSNKLIAQSWSELGGLNGLAANNWILSICADSAGNIYAAGNFTNGANSDSGKEYVAKYNGTSWNELGGLNSLAANAAILSVCADAAGNIYSAGDFSNGANSYSGNKYVAKYNGTSWSELGGLNGLAANDAIESICAGAAGNIYAGGYFTNGANYYSGKEYVAKYNGTSWSGLGALNGAAAIEYINSICADAEGNIYAAGYLTNDSGKYYVAKYNGTSWSELGGLNGLAVNNVILSICADSAGNIYAAGYFTNESGLHYVAKYNGTSWSELGGLNGLAANSTIQSICADAAGNIYAAGWFYNESEHYYVAKYNGTSWSELGGLNGLAANNGIKSIFADAAGNIYAGGDFTNNSGNEYVARYSIVTSIKGETVQAPQVIIYPNPATTQLTIHPVGWSSYGVQTSSSRICCGTVTLSIMNVLGQEALSYSLSFAEGKGEAIDVSKLSPGIYFVQIKSENGSAVNKFVKE